MGTDRLQIELLAYAGRLLLEYNESTGAIHRTLTATARAITDEKCDVVVSYGGIAVSVAGDGPLLMPIREFRYNAALQARVHTILGNLRRGEIDPAAALAELKRAEALTPPYLGSLVAIVLGVSAASLAVGSRQWRCNGCGTSDRIGSHRAKGARPASFQLANTTPRRGLHWSCTRRIGHPVRLDQHTGARIDRAVSNADPGSTPYQCDFRSRRQLCADVRRATGTRNRHHCC
jgi:hypothetical protein